MAIDPKTELSQFHDYITGCLARGESLTPEAALEMWRIGQPAAGDEETIQAVLESLADLEAGDRGIPAREFLLEFRRRQGQAEQ